MDAKFHYLLWREQDRELTKQGLQSIYRENLRRVPTLVLTQIIGIPVDQEENRRLQKKYQERIADCEEQIKDFKAVEIFEKRYKSEYRPSSNQDTIKLLRDVMDFREPEKENGAYSVDEEALAKIDHPIVPLIIQHRKASKQLSTYLLPYSDQGEKSLIWPDGLLHPIINPFGTLSNRTSSEEPNIQNQQKRNPEAKEIRKQIIPPPGHLVVSIDYGQIQARGIAMASKDKVFVKALWERYDIHTEWTERISRAYPSRIGGKKNFTDKKVMKAFRSDVKNQWTFPLFFGARLESVSEYLHVPVDIMEPLYDEFWNTFSGVKDWQDRLLKEYEETGVVQHLDGRLNRAPLSPNQIFNLPIQGVEAQIVLDAMNRLSEKATDTGDMYYQANLEIHDDLEFFLPENKVEGYVQEIVTDMLAADFDFINVPLTVEVGVGENLLEVEDVLEASSDTWRK